MASRVKKNIWGIFLCFALIFCFTAKAFPFDKKLSSALSHYIMGVIHEDLGNIEGAIKEYKDALKSEDKVSVIHLNLASSYLKANSLDKAIEELKSAAGLDPEAVEPRAILALLYSSMGKIDLATSEYEAALKNASRLQPKNIDLYKGLGAIYLQQKKFKEAEKVYGLVASLTPADPQAHLYLGSIYAELNNNARAEKEFKQALELKPDYHEAMNSLGYLYVEADKNLDQAESMIRKALSVEPDNGAYIDSLGWLYFKKGRIQEAIKELEKASILLKDPVIFSHLGDAYLKSGNLEKARLNWEKSLELNPSQDKLREKLKDYHAIQRKPN
jgi:Tfp pilus assembly protein PilF